MHVSNVTNMANSTLGFLHKNFKSCPPYIKSSCYKSLMVPIIEYGSTVWDPHLHKDINKIENIQRRIARFSGVTRLLLMPGQRPGKPPTHAAYIHMAIFIWTSVFFSKYVELAILYARSSNDKSPGVRTIQTDTGSSCALIPD